MRGEEIGLLVLDTKRELELEIPPIPNIPLDLSQDVPQLFAETEEDRIRMDMGCVLYALILTGTDPRQGFDLVMDFKEERSLRILERIFPAMTVKKGTGKKIKIGSDLSSDLVICNTSERSYDGQPLVFPYQARKSPFCLYFRPKEVKPKNFVLECNTRYFNTFRVRSKYRIGEEDRFESYSEAFDTYLWTKLDQLMEHRSEPEKIRQYVSNLRRLVYKRKEEISEYDILREKQATLLAEMEKKEELTVEDGDVLTYLKIHPDTSLRWFSRLTIGIVDNCIRELKEIARS